MAAPVRPCAQHVDAGDGPRWVCVKPAGHVELGDDTHASLNDRAKWVDGSTVAYVRKTPFAEAVLVALLRRVGDGLEALDRAVRRDDNRPE